MSPMITFGCKNAQKIESASLSASKMQIETTIRYQYTSIKISKIENKWHHHMA
jgi:hypothetical protein